MPPTPEERAAETAREFTYLLIRLGCRPHRIGLGAMMWSMLGHESRARS